jgi:hypothetical protein
MQSVRRKSSYSKQMANDGVLVEAMAGSALLM